MLQVKHSNMSLLWSRDVDKAHKERFWADYFFEVEAFDKIPPEEERYEVEELVTVSSLQVMIEQQRDFGATKCEL